ncbi:SAM-dependent methyltransferase [Halioglobus japonicus]|uniref:Class I SAM-dependent methyltransferase n=1 Tax=Halioglobus japonicus TaxID=930805 RepID=A0AAP8MDK3_9GAMM|nr:class I SAM-dependent methyltransferase [Halioglobus japonicus]AQA17859.1 SAM-dependent methyltransferase [Halioglobus japonicus]PLW85820.1 class I SAM-dependent methyltransferase [Halioglobus japonicus]GHD17678.1 hypothetical protein GCM10007052_24420 [Halioglobus japonicus]
MAIYDRIGKGYSRRRVPDPRIESQLVARLGDATSVLNIGAGTGSYEPRHLPLVALEPSFEMISQRSSGAAPVVQGAAERLPFTDNSFSHVMTVLSMHHWQDVDAGLREICRVARDAFVVLTWDPEAQPFWLTRDYFPAFYEQDCGVFPSMTQIGAHFKEVEVAPLMIPADCMDGFLAAYWCRPEAYLDADVQQSISSFSRYPDTASGLEKLRADLASGAWARQNKALMSREHIDAGYRLLVARL